MVTVENSNIRVIIPKYYKKSVNRKVCPLLLLPFGVLDITESMMTVLIKIITR